MIKMKNYFVKLHLLHSVARCQECDQNKTVRSDREIKSIGEEKILPRINTDRIYKEVK